MYAVSWTRPPNKGIFVVVAETQVEEETNHSHYFDNSWRMD